MRAGQLSDPRSVDAILGWHGLWPAARVALVSAYLVGGVTKLLDFHGAVAEQQHFGCTLAGCGRRSPSSSNSAAQSW